MFYLGVGVAALAGSLCVSGQANAACGDYVIVGGKKVLANHSPTMPDESAKPCHGPNCSQAPLLPPATTAPAPTLIVDDWMQAVLSTVPCIPPAGEWRAEHETFNPIHTSRSIFHPPRLS